MGGSREAVVQRNNQIAKTAKLTSGILRLDVAAHQMRLSCHKSATHRILLNKMLILRQYQSFCRRGWFEIGSGRQNCRGAAQIHGKMLKTRIFCDPDHARAGT
ncbi:hypothetical protein OEG86_11995 [Hoeflea alexandrii]|uniref:hypothetical protein n=1 Tax=Hoeflea alexandrii TaxID=288436 RepID=UPI002271A281|nr:hypothetical protein [Hoeflea alexandrii]MCY0152842.1 hypothetical protein [Hoeflea alexandrii]